MHELGCRSLSLESIILPRTMGSQNFVIETGPYMQMPTARSKGN